MNIAAVYVPPRNGQDSSAFDEARAAFLEVQASAFTVDDADEVGRIAAKLLGSAA